MARALTAHHPSDGAIERRSAGTVGTCSDEPVLSFGTAQLAVGSQAGAPLFSCGHDNRLVVSSSAGPAPPAAPGLQLARATRASTPRPAPSPYRALRRPDDQAAGGPAHPECG